MQRNVYFSLLNVLDISQIFATALIVIMIMQTSRLMFVEIMMIETRQFLL